MGPSALRVAGLQTRIKQLGHTVEDIGNLNVKQPEEQHYGDSESAQTLNVRADEVTCRGARQMVPTLRRGGRAHSSFPL